MKPVYNYNQSSVPERNYLFTSGDNGMRNLHKIILEQHGREALQLFKEWERFQLRDCDYRNHRILPLKCISNELVPVSLRLKRTIKTERARKIIRKVENDLLQARVKSTNSILGDNAKQRELSRSKLASIVPTSIMDKCQQFIDKVSELRFLKIKERQVNKFNRLLLKKQGNITWFSTVPPHKQAIPLRQVGPGQTALSRQPVLLLPKQLVPSQVMHRQLILRQSALIPREIAPFLPRHVVHRQLAMALTPREIVLFLLRQVVPGQSALMPRQPVPLPKQSALTPRVLVLPPHRQVVHKQ